MIIHGLVTSMIDYGNAVVFGVNVCLIQKLQIVTKLCSSPNSATTTSRPSRHALCSSLAVCEMANQLQTSSTVCYTISRPHSSWTWSCCIGLHQCIGFVPLTAIYSECYNTTWNDTVVTEPFLWN